MAEEQIPPVVKSVTVGVSVDQAFKIFTEDIATWWPAETHSLGEERVQTIVFETHAGGRLYERLTDGTEHDWARVLAYEPPHRVVVAWRVNPQWPAHTEWEATFSPRGPSTEVRIEHRGWEDLGPTAVQKRSDYDGGWSLVLGAFAARAG